MRLRGKRASKEKTSGWHCVSLALFATLVIDCFIDRPKGLKWIRSLFRIPDHGLVDSSCPWDDEGSWQIGLSSGSSPPWEWGSDEIDTVSPVLSCSDLDKNQYAPYVSDPFLLPLADDKWYLFFEYKNVKILTGEIGVSFSSDKGVSWKFLGSALKGEQGKGGYSYPFVHQDRHNPNIYHMIPSKKGSDDLSIYETTKEEFPLGWKLKHTPLKDASYSNTGVVWHDDRYWIFTSKNHKFPQGSSSLHLYHTHDLLEPWTEHKMSPLSRSAKLTGNSGGRPIEYNGNIYRFVQDKKKRMGEGINIVRVNVLTLDDYIEQHIKRIEPTKFNHWTKARLRHFDVHHKEGSWIVSFAADEMMENARYLEREWIFHCSKRFLMALVFIHSFYLISNFSFRFKDKIIPSLNSSVMNFLSSKNTITIKVASLASTPIVRNKKQLRAHMLYQFLMIFMSILISLYTTDIVDKCKENGSQETRECFDWKSNHLFTPSNHFSGIIPSRRNLLKKSFLKKRGNEPVKTPSKNIITKDNTSEVLTTNQLIDDADPLVIVTACSSTYFERLKNFVGSVHFWESDVNVLIYDIGLSKSNLLEISQWRRVHVERFDFQKYPVHVSFLYNFAWKILIFNEVAQKHQKFIFLDSGLEIRHPLIALRYYLEKDGYYSTQLEDGRHTIGPTTNPKTYEKLRELGVEFDEEEVKKQPFCAGGIQGFVNGHDSSILKTAVRCALDEDCISPKGSGRDHNYDQSVLSVLYYSENKGHFCDHKDIFADSDETVYTLDETRCNYVEMGARRWRLHRPYTKYIDRHISYQPPIEFKTQEFLVERNQGTSLKLNIKSNWRKCIQACNQQGERKEAENCIIGCKRNRQKKKVDFFVMLAYAKFDHFLTLLRKCALCKAIRLRILFVYLLISIIGTIGSARKTIKRLSNRYQD